MAGAVAFETEHFGEESPGFPRVLEGNRCGGYRSEILQSRLSSRITTKPISAPLSVSPTAPLFPSQAIKGARGSAKFRCANGSVQFAVAGGGNPLRAWFFLRNLGQQHPIANTTGPANSCAHGGRSSPRGSADRSRPRSRRSRPPPIPRCNRCSGPSSASTGARPNRRCRRAA